MSDGASGKISRRNFIAGGFATLLGGLGLSALSNANKSAAASSHSPHGQNGSGHDTGHGPAMMVGEVDHERNGFDPLRVLVDWDYGTISTLPNGQTLREYQFVAFDKEIEVAPGMFFPAWTYNGRVPGPTIRCTEGDRIRIKFINAGTHPHTIHFHGIHSFEMDGVPGAGSGEIKVGESFLYEFDAEPFGCHHYHCHAVPLKRHIHKGLYGAFIVDPKEGRPPARELMMMQNAFDLNFDGGNEVYAVNTVGFEYARRPIPAKVGELIRIYLINMIEFDPINSFHLHAEFFDYYDHGTTLEPTLKRVDTIMQAQAQRGILEFSYRWPGKYMYHAHVTEFTELGWMGQFNIVPEDQFDAALQEVGLDAEWDRLATEGAASTHTGESSNDE
jgi:FtsP/CotA-like multicopper oxidase with cupredoxin domain